MENEEKESEEIVSDVRVHGCSPSNHIYSYTYVAVCTLPGRCTERPTAMFLMLARGSLPKLREFFRPRRLTNTPRRHRLADS